MVPAGQQSIAEEAEARSSQGHTDRYEIVLCRKNGEKFPVLIGAGPRLDKQSGQYIGSMGVVTDICERKRVEEALRLSEMGLRQLFQESPLSTMLFDKDTRQLEWFDTGPVCYWRQPSMQ